MSNLCADYVLQCCVYWVVYFEKMAEKHKRVVLGLEKKIEIVKSLRKGEITTGIALNYGVGRTTVNDIKCNAEKIELHVWKMLSTDGDVKNRKTMKPAKYEQLDEAVYRWFIQAFSQGIPLSGSIIVTRAIEIIKNLMVILSLKEARDGLNKFRHGTRQLDTSGEKLNWNSAVIEDFKEQLKSIITSLKLDRE